MQYLRRVTGRENVDLRFALRLLFLFCLLSDENIRGHPVSVPRTAGNLLTVHGKRAGGYKSAERLRRRPTGSNRRERCTSNNQRIIKRQESHAEEDERIIMWEGK